MASLNLCQFIGNVGKIETRCLQNGDAVTNLSLAANEQWKDKATGEKKERTEWVNVSMFGKLAEIATQYVVKGSLIYVAGRMQTRKWTDKEGADKYTTEIIADQMKMLGGRQDAPKEAKPEPAPKQDNGMPQDMLDDVPF